MPVAEERRLLTPAIERQLARTPIRQWQSLAILLDSEQAHAQLMPRGELVTWLRANDLEALAKEAAARTVRAGAILTLTIGADGPRFKVLFDKPIVRVTR